MIIIKIQYKIAWYSIYYSNFGGFNFLTSRSLITHYKFCKLVLPLLIQTSETFITCWVSAKPVIWNFDSSRVSLNIGTAPAPFNVRRASTALTWHFFHGTNTCATYRRRIAHNFLHAKYTCPKNLQIFRRHSISSANNASIVKVSLIKFVEFIFASWPRN